MAWDYDPLTTLNLEGNLSGVHVIGKSDREALCTAALWLHKYHPKTLAYDVRPIAMSEYFKDLLEILYRLLEGPDVSSIQKAKRENIKEFVLDRRYWVLRGEANLSKEKSRLAMAKKI